MTIVNSGWVYIFYVYISEEGGGVVSFTVKVLGNRSVKVCPSRTKLRHKYSYYLANFTILIGYHLLRLIIVDTKYYTIIIIAIGNKVVQ